MSTSRANLRNPAGRLEAQSRFRPYRYYASRPARARKTDVVYHSCKPSRQSHHPECERTAPLLELLKSDAAHILENRLESLGISFDPIDGLVYPFVEFNAQPLLATFQLDGLRVDLALRELGNLNALHRGAGCLSFRNPSRNNSSRDTVPSFSAATCSS